jgi:hypothetical protein
VLTLTLKLLSDMDRLTPPAGPAKSAKSAKAAKSAKSAEPARARRSKHDPRTDDPARLSEEAFAQARQAMPAAYFHALLWLLGELFESRHGARLRWHGMRLLALDGTLVTLPRRAALAEHFGTARNQHRAARRTPQARLVMLQLPLARLPWRYEVTPKAQGESAAAARLLADVRAGDVVLMDRGFFHFDLFRQVRDAKAFFAVRVIRRARARFRTVRRLGRDDRVVTWRPAARRWGGARIQLRVIDYQVKGFRRTAIVTNQLDAARVSRAQFVGPSDSPTWQDERDAGLYHRRWEIETTFAEMKAEMKMEAGLRGRTPRTIEYELGGHVLLYVLVRWTIVEAAAAHGAEPLRVSFKHALEEVRHTAGLLPIAAGDAHRRRLVGLMLARIAAHLVPFRPGRHYPRPNDGKKRHTGKGYRLVSSRIAKKKT